MSRTSDPITPPTILSGSEIYDHIMSQIEPELTIAELPRIAERTKGETPEQRQERAQRYTQAFETYDERFRAYSAEWNQDFQRYRRFSFHALEEFTKGIGQTHLDTIVQSIHTA